MQFNCSLTSYEYLLGLSWAFIISGFLSLTYVSVSETNVLLFESICVPCPVLGFLNKIFSRARHVVDLVVRHSEYGNKQNHKNPLGFWWRRERKMSACSRCHLAYSLQRNYGPHVLLPMSMADAAYQSLHLLFLLCMCKYIHLYISVTHKQIRMCICICIYIYKMSDFWPSNICLDINFSFILSGFES